MTETPALTDADRLAEAERRIAAAKAVLAHEVAHEDRNLALFLIGEALDGRSVDDDDDADAWAEEVEDTDA